MSKTMISIHSCCACTYGGQVMLPKKRALGGDVLVYACVCFVGIGVHSWNTWFHTISVFSRSALCCSQMFTCDQHVVTSFPAF